MSNLRQIGAATQMYMNDNNGVVPRLSNGQVWMSQLEQNPKYLSSWRVLESPFDKRSTAESGDGTTASAMASTQHVCRVTSQYLLTKLRSP